MQNRQCRHNLNYWQFGDYLGIGAGAHGKLTMPDGQISRYSKFRHPEKYMDEALKGKARSSEKHLKKEDLEFEFILNAIRLKEGFSKELFETRTLLPLSNIQSKVDSLIKANLIKGKNNQYKTTQKGWMFINDIVERFL